MWKNTRGGTSARSFALTTLLLSGMLVACGGDDDGTAPPVDFDEQAAANDLDAVLGAVSQDATTTLLLAAQGLANTAAAPALFPALASISPESGGLAGIAEVGDAKLGLAASALLPNLSATSSVGAEPIFPSNLLGKTFVWGGTGYVPDDTLPGAPANGVRFIAYAINPLTRLPVEPLVEVGYLDLTDDGSPASTRLGILLVDTSGASDVTLVDYFIDVSIQVVGETVTVTLLARGFVSDGTQTVTFDLDQGLSLDQTGAGTFTVDYAFDVAGLSLGFQAAASLDLTQETSGFASTMTLREGSDVVVLNVTESATGAIDGQITFNGSPVILVAGTALNPQFTRPDGSELTEVEVQALVDIVDAVTEILLVAEELFAPISGAMAV
ncbi:MAG: hypothetical protein ABFS34_15685 [Gemmatimonadota bacterium]